MLAIASALVTRDTMYDLPNPLGLSFPPMEYAEYRERAEKWLNSKWTNDKICPLCNTNDWSIAALAEISMRTTELGRVYTSLAIPVIPVTCANCGYVMFISALVTDVLDGAESERVEVDPKDRMGGE
jgi:predicted nucleic-acid-binding Zn-ribbon protein